MTVLAISEKRIFVNIEHFTNSSKEAQDIFNEIYGTKGEDTLWNKEHGYTTPKELSIQYCHNIGYQTAVIFTILFRMKGNYMFEEVKDELGDIKACEVSKLTKSRSF